MCANIVFCCLHQPQPHSGNPNKLLRYLHYFWKVCAPKVHCPTMSTLTFGSYDGPAFHLVHSSNGFLDHIPEPSGCLHIGKLSPSPHICSLKPKLQQPADASTSRCISQAEKCGDMAAVSACCCLSSLAASQHLHTPLEKSPGHSLSHSFLVDIPPGKQDSQDKGICPLSWLPVSGAKLIPNIINLFLSSCSVTWVSSSQLWFL